MRELVFKACTVSVWEKVRTGQWEKRKSYFCIYVSGKFGQMSDVFMMGQVVSLCLSNYSFIIVS